jgi:hypothetical protein
LLENGHTVNRKREVCKEFNMNLRYIVRELDVPGPGWCAMVGFANIGVERSGSAARQLV